MFALSLSESANIAASSWRAKWKYHKAEAMKLNPTNKPIVEQQLKLPA
jgi:hypothetical protein